VDKAGKKDVTILICDLNATIGKDSTGYNDIMRTHGLGEMNNNAERFSDLCSLNQLVIVGSIFPHKQIHNATWRSPDNVAENQIDHICISKNFRRSMEDIRVMRGADVPSDHHLLVTSIKFGLKLTNLSNRRIKNNITSHKSKEVKAAFQLKLSNKFQPLQDQPEENASVDSKWRKIKSIWKETCVEILGENKVQRKEWVSVDTIRKLDKSKEISSLHKPDQSYKSKCSGGLHCRRSGGEEKHQERQEGLHR